MGKMIGKFAGLMLVVLVLSWMFPGNALAHREAELGEVHPHAITVTGDKMHFALDDTIELKITFNRDASCNDEPHAALVFKHATASHYIYVSWSQWSLDQTYSSSDEHYFHYVVNDTDLEGEYYLTGYDPNQCYGPNGETYYPGHDYDYFYSLFTEPIVIDKTGPWIESAQVIASKRVFSAGEKVSFEVTMNEPIRNPQQFSILLNNQAIATYMGLVNARTLQFEYTVQEGDDIIGLNTVELVDGTLQDLAGNVAASPQFHLTIDPGLIMDTSAPQVVVLSDSEERYASRHSLILQVTDRDTNPQIYYKWDQSETTPAASVITEAGAAGGYPLPQPTEANGDYYVHIKVIDDAGNQTIGTFGPYGYDQVPPHVALNPEQGESNEPLTITITATDALSGVKQLAYHWQGTAGDPTIVNGSSITISTPPNDGTHVLLVIATDHAGNEQTYTSGSYTVDQTAPDMMLSSQGNSTPSKRHQVEVEVAGREGESGRVDIQWTIDSMDFPVDDDEGWQLMHHGAFPVKETIVTPDEANGTLFLHVRAEDQHGNVRRVTTQEGFIVDNTPPAVQFHPNGNNDVYASQIEIQLQVDGSSTHLDRNVMQYAITPVDMTGVPQDEWVMTSDGIITLSGLSGHYVVHVQVEDEAGNSTYITSRPFALDHVSPTGSVQFARDYTNETGTQIQLQATDNIATSPIEVSYSLNDGLWSDWQALQPSLTVALESEEGMQWITVKYRDQAGNVSEEYTSQIIYDITPPQFSEYTLTPTDWTNQEVEVTLYYTDNLSPDGQVVQVFEHSGSYSLTFTDLAGNQNTEQVTITNIDKEKPMIQFSMNGTAAPRQAVTTRVTVIDDLTPWEQILVNYSWSTSRTLEPTDWTELDEQGDVHLSDVDGDWYLWVKASDKAGNTSLVTSPAFVLDNTPPTATITYNPATRTALPVTARITLSEEATVTTPTDESLEYTFVENGIFTFEMIDAAGNVGTVTAVVDWIDSSLPSAQVTMTPNHWTNSDVEVKVNVEGLPPRELLRVQAPSDATLVRLVTMEHGVMDQPIQGATVTEAVYRFTNNGLLSFIVLDLQTGQESSNEVEINHIDRTPPVGELIYSHTTWTNEDVTVTLRAQDDRSAVTVQGGSTYTFTENGSYTFIFHDEAGNEAEMTAIVDFIDKELPQAIVTYSPDTWTTESVTATVQFINETEPVRVLNNGGQLEYMFHENGSFTLHYVDVAGNAGQTTLTVDWIDREAPTGTLLYSSLGWTNQDVLVTLEARDNSGQPSIFLNEGGHQHLFTVNGQFTFEVMDPAGNRSSFTAVVDRIDKTPPEAEVYYSTTTWTNGSVRATLSPNEPIMILNNEGSNYVDFTDNGRFTFDIADRAGNRTTVTAEVDWIDRVAPVPQVSYSTTAPTSQDVVASVTADKPFYVQNNNRSRQYVFKENGSFVFVIQDLAGNTAEITAEVNNIDKGKANITLHYSETEPTTDDVIVTVEADRPLTIVNNDQSPIVTFKQNGVFWLEAKDDLNETYLIPIEVTNIDRTKPEIGFAQGDPLFIIQGNYVDPLADVQAMDNLDGDVTQRIEVQHDVDSSTPGEYSIIYRVRDRAGNETVVERKAHIVQITGLTIFVNSQDTSQGETFVTDTNVWLRVFGEQGDIRVRWAYGKLDLGMFKMNDQWLRTDSLPIDRQGYYTFLVEDQERHYQLIHVYVIPTP